MRLPPNLRFVLCLVLFLCGGAFAAPPSAPPQANTLTTDPATGVVKSQPQFFRQNRAKVIADGLGTAAERGAAKVVHIAVRTDGRDGVGTAEDPRDGSTAAKLDALIPTLAAGCIIQLEEGTFETSGVAVTYQLVVTTSSGVVMKSGSVLRGRGRERTVLRLKANTIVTGTYNTTTTLQRRDMILSDADSAGAVVEHLTVDANRDNQSAFTSSSANTMVYAVNLTGLDSAIRDVTVRGVWNLHATDELFPVAISSTQGTWALPATGTIERVTYETAPGYSTALNLLAPSTSVTVSSIGTNDTVSATAHGLADGATVYFPSLTGGTGLAVRQRYFVRDATTNSFKVALVPGGTAVDVTVAYSAATCYRQTWITGTMRDNVIYGRTEGAYSATQGFGCGGWKDVLVESNRTIGTWTPVLIDTHFFSGVVVRNNYFQGRADPAGLANLGVWIANYGTDNVRVEGNTFLLSRNSQGVGINGNVAGAVVANNVFLRDGSTGGSFAQAGIEIAGTGNTNVKVTGNRFDSGISNASFPTSFGADLVWATDNRLLTGGDTGLPDNRRILDQLAVTSASNVSAGSSSLYADQDFVYVNRDGAGTPFINTEEAIIDWNGGNFGGWTFQFNGAAMVNKFLTTSGTGQVTPITLTAGQSVRMNAGATALEAVTPLVLGSEVPIPTVSGSDPVSPATGAVLYVKDVAGKKALFVRFPTGAPQQVSIEP